MIHFDLQSMVQRYATNSISNSFQIEKQHVYLENVRMFLLIHLAMVKRQPSYETNCPKWSGCHMVKKLENGTMTLKHKSFLEVDISGTGLEDLIKEFNK